MKPFFFALVLFGLSLPAFADRQIDLPAGGFHNVMTKDGILTIRCTAEPQPPTVVDRVCGCFDMGYAHSRHRLVQNLTLSNGHIREINVAAYADSASCWKDIKGLYAKTCGVTDQE